MHASAAVSLALVALALWSAPTYAQGFDVGCNATTTCMKEGQSCAQPSTPNSFVICASGSFCSGNTCTRQPRVGETCTIAVPCFDETYPGGLSCVSGTCKWDGIYLPGESCNNGNNYNNGGCVFGSCGSDNKCTNIALNGNCSGSTQLCAPGLYCNGQLACANRQALNSNCGSNIECDPALVCTNLGTTAQPTCQTPFQQSANKACSTTYDCNAGLLCRQGTCQSPSTAPSGNCANNEALCGSTTECECNSKRSGNTLTEQGTGQCVAPNGFDNDFVNQVKSFQNCAKNKACQDFWAITNALRGAIPRGPNQCTQSCSRNLLFDTPIKAGNCFSSASIAVVPALLALFVAVVALLAL